MTIVNRLNNQDILLDRSHEVLYKTVLRGTLFHAIIRNCSALSKRYLEPDCFNDKHTHWEFVAFLMRNFSERILRRERMKHDIANDPAYTVQTQNENCAVVDAMERTIVTCRDKLNAEHYATLLNQAYKSGYKQGYADGKKGRS